MTETHYDWRCPECGLTARTPPTAAKSQTMHQCPKLRGLVAPMVREGIKAQIVLAEPEGYVEGKVVQTDPELGRPIMNMSTNYADGSNDLVVFANSANVKARRSR